MHNITHLLKGEQEAEKSTEFYINNYKCLDKAEHTECWTTRQQEKE